MINKKDTEMTYYSQAGEDQFIYENYIKNKKLTNSYLEMGALDGVKYSNTKFFEDHLGWSGILIEPNPISYELLKINRPKNILFDTLISDSKERVDFIYFENINLAAVSGVCETMSKGNLKNFYESDDKWIKNQRDVSLKKIEKETVSLDEVIKQSGLSEIGFFTLDVEGHELNVLKSFSFDIEVSLFLIECNHNDKIISEIMIRNGYTFTTTVSHNNLWLSKKYIEYNK